MTEPQPNILPLLLPPIAVLVCLCAYCGWKKLPGLALFGFLVVPLLLSFGLVWALPRPEWLTSVWRYFLPLIILLGISPFLAFLLSYGLKIFFFSAQDEGRRARSVLLGALLGALGLGFAGFIAGFFGPLILAPEANQGPLLGIFITGPLGFCLGAVTGALYGCLQKAE